MIKGYYTGVFGCCGAGQLTQLNACSKQQLEDVIKMWKTPNATGYGTADYSKMQVPLIPEFRTTGVQANPYAPVATSQIVTPTNHPTQTIFAVTAEQQQSLWPDLQESGFLKILTFDSNHGAIGNRQLVLWAKPRAGQGNISVGVEAMKLKTVVVANQEDFEKKFQAQEVNIRALQDAQRVLTQTRDQLNLQNGNLLRVMRLAAPRSKNLRDILEREGIQL